ncbi:uncharacterized protein LOC143245476 [Tachypleus tridentatus]|uniref:uncharacterized protein LOC143245476 n=1 Tax=Tachypleus tridentatus TaxID=6853 RepID=UPI003FD0206B
MLSQVAYGQRVYVFPLGEYLSNKIAKIFRAQKKTNYRETVSDVSSISGMLSVFKQLLVLLLSGKPVDIGIIQTYATTADKVMTEIERFYEDIEKAMKQLKLQDIKIIMGDFNAKVGKNKIDKTVGPFGIGELNERGERLVDRCKEHDIAVMNTWFKNHPRRCWTWKSPGDRVRNQIDFILMQKRYRNSTTSCKSMPGADCSSDHIPVVATMIVKLEKLKKSKKEPRLQLNLLEEDEELKKKYIVCVKNKFDILDKILNLMEERRKAKPNEEKYQKINRLVKKKCNVAKEEWINTQCAEIENNKVKDSKYMHKKISEVTGKTPSAKTGCLKSKNGEILMDKKDILNRWSEYIGELYNDNISPTPHIEIDTEGLPIMPDEVEHAMKKIHKGKAAGPDDIPIELLLALKEVGIQEVTKLLNIIYDTGEIPEDFKKSVFIALPKKPGTTDCEQHRIISLMCHLTKVLLRVLMSRMKNKIRPEISDTQFGFIADKGTRNFSQLVESKPSKLMDNRKKILPKILFLSTIKKRKRNAP